jgi:predicted RND superfamily exporter protein
LKKELEVPFILDRKTQILLIVSFIFIASLIGYTKPQFRVNNQAVSYNNTSPAADMSMTYFEENETARIVVENGDEYNRSNTHTLWVEVDRQEKPVIQAERTSKDGIWASQDQYSAANFPIKEGSKLTLVSDGQDEDNDGQKGIDGNESIAIYYNRTSSSDKRRALRSKRQIVMAFELKETGKVVEGNYTGGDIIKIDTDFDISKE